jgi:outer membrane autotransporter protein
MKVNRRIIGAATHATAVRAAIRSVLKTLRASHVLGEGASCMFAEDSRDDGLNCAWVQGIRQWGHADGDSFGLRYDWTMDGVQVGIDHTAQSGWTFGFSAAWTQTDTHDVHWGNRSDLQSVFGGLYTGYVGERLRFGAVATYGDHESKTARRSTVGDSVQYARTEFDTDSYGFGMRLDYRVTAADQPVVRPFLEAHYERIGDTGFSEKGSDIQLAGVIHERESLRGIVGVRIANDYEGYGVMFRPSFEFAVVQQFLDVQTTMDVQSFDGAAFRSHGARQDRTSYRLNAQLGIATGSNTQVIVGYGGELAEDRSQHEVNLGFRVMW